MSRVKNIRPRPVDIFKSLIVVRNATELVGSHEEEGGAQAKGKATSATTTKSELKEVKKKVIPTPIIFDVKEYEQEQPATYQLPVGYIRYPKRVCTDEDYTTVEYDLELEDQTWLRQHKTYGVAGTEPGKIDYSMLERMIDALEKATAMAPQLISQQQAETVFVSKLGMAKIEFGRIWTEVYNYWKAKRQKLGKPLMRRFWAVTSPNDTDPHKVFRPREKERYKLRKHRKNDMESYRKMLQLKRDFVKLSDVLDLVRSREKMKQEALLVQQELFEQAVYDLTDTTGRPRPLNINPGEYKMQQDVKNGPDLMEVDGVSGMGSVGVADVGGVIGVGGGGGLSAAGGVDDKTRKKKKKKKNERGGPAVEVEEELGTGPKLVVSVLPSFMDELPTRDADIPFDVELEPHIPSVTLTKSKASFEPIFKFRCRGRVGRGGRVIFDRVPCPQSSNEYYGLLNSSGREDDSNFTSKPVVIYTSGVRHPFNPPAVYQLQPPLSIHLSDRQLRDIYAMEEDQEELLEPLGLGVAGAVQPQAGAPVIKYSVPV